VKSVDEKDEMALHQMYGLLISMSEDLETLKTTNSILEAIIIGGLIAIFFHLN